MDVIKNINKSIKKSTMNDYNKIIYNVAQSLIDKFKNTDIVSKQNKKIMIQYFRDINNQSGGVIPPVLISKIKSASIDDLIANSIIGLLTDINKYELIGIENLLNYGGDANDVMIFFFINDIEGITQFCYNMNLTSDQSYKLITIKKLSALYKVENNFNI